MGREEFMIITEELDMIETALRTVMYKLLPEKSQSYEKRMLFDHVREATRHSSDAQEMIREILYG